MEYTKFEVAFLRASKKLMEQAGDTGPMISFTFRGELYSATAYWDESEAIPCVEEFCRLLEGELNV